MYTEEDRQRSIREFFNKPTGLVLTKEQKEFIKKPRKHRPIKSMVESLPY